MWTTCNEFIEMGAGDWEEHAILLANYLLWMESNAGSGSPVAEGQWRTYVHAVPPHFYSLSTPRFFLQRLLWCASPRHTLHRLQSITPVRYVSFEHGVVCLLCTAHALCDPPRYLVLGRAIPEGQTVWVLRLHVADNLPVLINACTVRQHVWTGLSHAIPSPRSLRPMLVALACAAQSLPAPSIRI